ncbi:12908_t:CDS:2 [Gigaspora rosea]|nr:12908_t:CDS:2 [Gigaspora rosea]
MIDDNPHNHHFDLILEKLESISHFHDDEKVKKKNTHTVEHSSRLSRLLQQQGLFVI